MAPPLIAGALLFTVLVLGWAGGASDARAELDRLTRLEAGRQLQAKCNAAARDRLEATNEALRAQARDSQAAIELFTAAQAKNMIRITALESENAELRKRPSAEVLRATSYRLVGEIMREPGDEAQAKEAAEDDAFLSGIARGVVMMLSALLRQMDTPLRVAEHTDDLAVESK